MPVSLPVLASSANASSSASATAVDIVISVAVLVLILYRQLQVRRASPTLILPVILIIIGLAELATLKGSNKLTAGEIGVLVALLVLDAVGLGAVRAWTVRLWHDGDAVLRKGTWLTVVLWLVGIGVHEVVDLVAHIPSASLLLYLGVTLLAQQLVLQTRINRVEHQPGNVTAGPPATPAGKG